jgi:hypothetical protein
MFFVLLGGGGGEGVGSPPPFSGIRVGQPAGRFNFGNNSNILDKLNERAKGVILIETTAKPPVAQRAGGIRRGVDVRPNTLRKPFRCNTPEPHQNQTCFDRVLIFSVVATSTPSPP